MQGSGGEKDKLAKIYMSLGKHFLGKKVTEIQLLTNHV
jgi:hypothetical protein